MKKNIFSIYKKESGFTLIELLVVIAIIGILSSIVIASLRDARMKSRDTTRVAQLKQIQTYIENYANENNGNYPSITADSRCVSPSPDSSACGALTSWNTLGTMLGVTLPIPPFNGRQDGVMCGNCDEYFYITLAGGGYRLMTYLAVANSPLKNGSNVYGIFFEIQNK